MRRRALVAPSVDESEDEGPIRMNFHPLSSQLGVSVEVEVDVVERQVAVGRESCRRMNLQIRISMKLFSYQRFSKVHNIYLRSYRRCSLCSSRACQI